MRQAAQVLRPGGRLVVEDSLAPDEPALAAFLEELEKRRDSTHVHSLSRTEWVAACAAAGLRIVRETRITSYNVCYTKLLRELCRASE